MVAIQKYKKGVPIRGERHRREVRRWDHTKIYWPCPRILIGRIWPSLHKYLPNYLNNQCCDKPKCKYERMDKVTRCTQKLDIQSSLKLSIYKCCIQLWWQSKTSILTNLSDIKIFLTWTERYWGPTLFSPRQITWEGIRTHKSCRWTFQRKQLLPEDDDDDDDDGDNLWRSLILIVTIVKVI